MGYEFDNLYIDMNGIIHPCAHPEDRPAPESELEMYRNIATYVDRLFAAIRPRKLLYLAIDGVAPRAKMNQQRSRRFRTAQEVRQRNAIIQELKESMGDAYGGEIDDEEEENKQGEWDSNVITPGTAFMHKLSDFLRFYITDRINRGGEAWKRCAVILSDASEPGEGEHKIMAYIRQQRTQPGYNPNLRHVLHGLDADLIMLGLALHESHFTVLREEVLLGRARSQGSKVAHYQATYDTLKSNGGIEAIPEEKRWCYTKPLVLCQISVLREYLAIEFSVLQGSLPFEFDFERIVDDFVFICFFIGNDFLPHLPTLDIRDGAIDFLFNVYKRILPTLGDYLTGPGGSVCLENVDIILAEVGTIEDEVFQRRKGAEDSEKARRIHRKTQREMGLVHGKADLDRLRLIASGDMANAVEVKKKTASIKPVTASNDANQSAAAMLRASLRGEATTESTEDASEEVDKSSVIHPSSIDNGSHGGSDNNVDNNGKDNLPENLQEISVGKKLSAEEKEARAKKLNEAYQARHQATLDEYSEKISDEIRFWQAGWKDRYYADKYKEADIAKGGGRERVFREYVVGLCWVMKYYYEGCASWKWYYPFHYAPFASDLRNIEQYEPCFDASEPFRPIEQLMAVLPKESVAAIPPACHDLMLSPNSPITDFYPEEIESDPNGKAMPWLWVVLLPFIDEERLLENLVPTYEKFDDEEKDRNCFRTATIYAHTENGALGRKMAEALAGAANAQEEGLIDEEEGFRVDADCGLTGLGGNLAIPCIKTHPRDYACHVRTLGQTIDAPFDMFTSEKICDNKVLSTQYFNPIRLLHLSELLEGAVLPRPKLSPYDMNISTPRLNRNMNISDLGKGNQPQQHSQYLRQKQPNQQHFPFQNSNQGQTFNTQPFYGNAHPMQNQLFYQAIPPAPVPAMPPGMVGMPNTNAFGGFAQVPLPPPRPPPRGPPVSLPQTKRQRLEQSYRSSSHSSMQHVQGYIPAQIQSQGFAHPHPAYQQHYSQHSAQQYGQSFSHSHPQASTQINDVHSLRHGLADALARRNDNPKASGGYAGRR